MVQVWGPGTDVSVNDDIPAVVVQVCLSGSPSDPHIQYQVAWFDGRTRHVQWLETSEVAATAGKKVPVGFWTGNRDNGKAVVEGKA